MMHDTELFSKSKWFIFTHISNHLVCLLRKAHLLQEITNENRKENRTIENYFYRIFFHKIDSASARENDLVSEFVS